MIRDRYTRALSTLNETRVTIARLSRRVDALLEQSAVADYAHLARSGTAVSGISQPDSRRALLETLHLVGVEAHAFVDIGSGSRAGTTGFLARRLGWKGVFADISEHAIGKISRAYRDFDVEAVCLEVTPDNVDELIGRLGVAPDLVKIDIDGYDYWVWKGMTIAPRLVVIEYNARFGLDPVTVPFGALPAKRVTGYHGASLRALSDLGARKGYCLIGCNHEGTNAFFGRADTAATAVAKTPEEAWRPILSHLDPGDVPRATTQVLREIGKRRLPLERVGGSA